MQGSWIASERERFFIVHLKSRTFIFENIMQDITMIVEAQFLFGKIGRQRNLSSSIWFRLYKNLNIPDKISVVFIRNMINIIDIDRKENWIKNCALMNKENYTSVTISLLEINCI